MNLKYYLRGLGIGIIVTAVIMSIAGNDSKEKLSDAEIKARAAELGMVEESGRLSELAGEETTLAPEKDEVAETPEPTKTPEATKTPEPTKTPEATKTPEPTKTPEATKTPEPTKAPKATAEPTTKPSFQMIAFTVNPGESSYTICKHLKELGLIASAEDFDTYLCDKGLDKRLRAGSFEIPKDAEPEEIAKILTF